MRKTYAVDPPKLLARNDAAALASGRHIAVTRGCVDCHGENGGGKSFIEVWMYLRSLPPREHGAR